MPRVAPQPIPANAPYWDGVAAGRLVLPRCRRCGAVSYYPRTVCQSCLSTDLEWTQMTGKGVVYSYTITRVAPAGFEELAPYVVASVELDEGTRVMTNIVDCAPDDVRIGQRVKAVYREGLPLFAPDNA